MQLFNKQIDPTLKVIENLQARRCELLQEGIEESVYLNNVERQLEYYEDALREMQWSHRQSYVFKDVENIIERIAESRFDAYKQINQRELDQIKEWAKSLITKIEDNEVL